MLAKAVFKYFNILYLFISLQKSLIDPESNNVQTHNQSFLKNKCVLKEGIIILPDSVNKVNKKGLVNGKICVFTRW